MIMINKIQELLGSEADALLKYKAKFPKEQLHLPGPDLSSRAKGSASCGELQIPRFARDDKFLKCVSGCTGPELLELQLNFLCCRVELCNPKFADLPCPRGFRTRLVGGSAALRGCLQHGTERRQIRL